MNGAKKARHTKNMKALIGANEQPKWNDPQANPEQLAKQAKKVPKTYMNPNLPLSALALGAANYPLYVEQNPVLGLLQLENPVTFRDIQVNLSYAWTVKMEATLSDAHKRLYAADCAEHVLPIFRKFNDQDASLVNAIEAARDYANKPTPYITKLVEAGVDISNLLWKMTGGSFKPVAMDQFACCAAMNCISPQIKVVQAAPKNALWAVREAAIYLLRTGAFTGPQMVKQGSLAMDEERLWQANRVRHYYSLEHPEYQPDLNLVGATSPFSIEDQSKNPSRRQLMAPAYSKSSLSHREAIGSLLPKGRKLPYLGQCDRIRCQGAQAEHFWQEMMRNKVPVSIKALEAACDVSAILDEGEKLQDFVAKNDHGYFKSQVKGQPVWFVSSAGFEFIFAEKGPSTSTIGGKSKWDDPKVEAKDLKRIAKKNPKAYVNPNMAFDDIVDGAHKFPWYVEQNPVLGLLELEDPYKFRLLKGALAVGWRSEGIQQLSEKTRRLLSVEFAEMVLPIFERMYPERMIPRDAIETAQRFANGRATIDELSDAHRAADNLITAYRKQLSSGKKLSIEDDEFFNSAAAYFAASAAFYASATRDNYPEATTSALEAALQAVSEQASAEYGSQGRTEAFIKQLMVQTNRIKELYAQEHPEFRLPPSTVGAKAKWNDASQDPKELKRLAKRNYKAYANPNMPFDELMKGARLAPWYVEQNPVLGLLALEDPGKQEILLEAIETGWKEAGMMELSLPHKRQFAIDCAERCLPLVEGELPKKKQARNAIQAARDYLEGKITKKELEEARQEALALAVWIENNPKMGHGTTSRATRAAAATALAEPQEYTAAMEASLLSIQAIIWSGNVRQDIKRAEELKWQVERIREYYALEHPDYQKPLIAGRVAKPRKKRAHG